MSSYLAKKALVLFAALRQRSEGASGSPLRPDGRYEKLTESSQEIASAKRLILSLLRYLYQLATSNQINQIYSSSVNQYRKTQNHNRMHRRIIHLLSRKKM